MLKQVQHDRIGKTSICALFVIPNLFRDPDVVRSNPPSPPLLKGGVGTLGEFKCQVL
jgi:hypothetical protein